LLQFVPLAGNIRENTERHRAICNCLRTENFSWMRVAFAAAHATGPKSQLELSQKLASQEKDRLRLPCAKAEDGVSGPSGAAAKLGIQVLPYTRRLDH